MSKLHEYIAPFACTFVCLLRHHAFEKGTDLHVEFIVSAVSAYVLRKTWVECRPMILTLAGKAGCKAGDLWIWIKAVMRRLWTWIGHISVQTGEWMWLGLSTMIDSTGYMLVWIQDRTRPLLGKMVSLFRGELVRRMCRGIAFLLLAAVGALVISLSALWVLFVLSDE